MCIFCNEGENEKTVNISIIDDDMYEDDETFVVMLKNPTNEDDSSIKLGEKDLATVTITDEDGPETNGRIDDSDYLVNQVKRLSTFYKNDIQQQSSLVNHDNI